MENAPYAHEDQGLHNGNHRDDRNRPSACFRGDYERRSHHTLIGLVLRHRDHQIGIEPADPQALRRLQEALAFALMQNLAVKLSGHLFPEPVHYGAGEGGIGAGDAVPGLHALDGWTEESGLRRRNHRPGCGIGSIMPAGQFTEAEMKKTRLSRIPLPQPARLSAITFRIMFGGRRRRRDMPLTYRLRAGAGHISDMRPRGHERKSNEKSAGFHGKIFQLDMRKNCVIPSTPEVVISGINSLLNRKVQITVRAHARTPDNE